MRWVVLHCNDVAGRRSGRCQRGVTLLEMLVVIALMAMVGVMIATSINGGMAGMQLRGAAKDIAAQLRFARTQAVVNGRVQPFDIHPAQRTWSSVRGRHGTLPTAIEVSFSGAAQLQPRPDAGRIEFYPDGASSGGRIVLRRDDSALQVEVAWLTGEVSIQALQSPGVR